jgi:hypothetical protein
MPRSYTRPGRSLRVPARIHAATSRLDAINGEIERILREFPDLRIRSRSYTGTLRLASRRVHAPDQKKPF